MAGSGFASYQWSTGETSQSIVATQTNVFSVTVTDTIGCTGFDVADLNVFPAPIIQLSDTILCEGSSFLFNAGGGAASYIWHDGSTGQVFQIDSIGTVSVTVTSFFGCEGTETASITAVVPNPTPSISSTSSLAPVTLDAGNGYLAYLWNTNESTQTIDVAIAGTYTCTVTDLNGCQGSSDKKAKIWPNAIDKLDWSNEIIIFPNPVDQLLTVEFQSEIRGNYDVFILDGAGRVTKKFINRTGQLQTLQVSDIASGNYLIRVQSDELKLEQPFIIIH